MRVADLVFQTCDADARLGIRLVRAGTYAYLQFVGVFAADPGQRRIPKRIPQGLKLIKSMQLPRVILYSDVACFRNHDFSADIKSPCLTIRSHHPPSVWQI